MNAAKPFLAMNIIGYCVVVPLLLFIAVPLFMVGNSPSDFGFLNLKVLLLAGLLWGIAGTLLLLLVGLILVRMQKSDLVLYGLRFLFWWVLIAGFLLPISVSAGMVDASIAKIDVINLMLTAVLAVVLSWLLATAARQYLFAFAAVLCLVSLASSIQAIASSGIAESKSAVAETSPAAELSMSRNVLVISLDGLQGHIIAEILSQNTGLANVFKDFTLYKNALSQSPATEASMVGELFGVRDYKALGDNIDEVKDALLQEGVAQQIPLMRETDAYQKRYPFGAGAQLSQSVAAATAESVEFLEYALARVGTRFAVDNRVSRTAVAALVDALAEDGSDALAAKLRNHKGPDWDRSLITEIYEYDAYTASLSASDKATSYRYMHFAFTHHPVDFDAQCEYRSDDKHWHVSKQNMEGLRGESLCALSKLRQFIQKLKDIGVYEQSLIVFKSDHGQPTAYFTERPYNLEINRHGNWGYSRYRPLLMLKPAGRTQDRMALRTDLVLLNDLANTICRQDNDSSVDCDLYPGKDLLGDIDADSEYFLYVVRSRSSSFTFDDHSSVRIESRIIDPVDGLSSSDTVTFRENTTSAD